MANYQLQPSPVGWYIATYIHRFTYCDAANNNDPDARFTCWENTLLIRSDSVAEAFDKATQIGQQEQGEPYENPNGEQVQFIFEGIAELIPLQESLEDGNEIYWLPTAPRKLKTIQGRVNARDAFLGE